MNNFARSLAVHAVVALAVMFGAVARKVTPPMPARFHQTLTPDATLVADDSRCRSRPGHSRFLQLTGRQQGIGTFGDEGSIRGSESLRGASVSAPARLPVTGEGA